MIIKRFLIIALTGIILSFSLLLYVIAEKESSQMEMADRQKSRLYAESVTTALGTSMSSGKPETAKKIVDSMNEKGDIKISVFRDDGTLVFGQEGLRLPPGALKNRQTALVSKGSVAVFLNPVLNETGCHRCHGQGKTVLGVVAVQMPPKESAVSIADAGRNLIFFGILLVFSASAAIFLVAKKMLLDPIAQIHRGVEVFQSGELGHRISLQRSDELGALADTFDQMAGSLEKVHHHLETAVRQKTTELRVIAELSTEVFKGNLPMGIIIEQFLTAITGEMGFGYAALCLIDREGGVISQEFKKGLSEGFCASDISLASGHPLARAIREAVPSVKKYSDVDGPATCSEVAVVPILSHQRKRCRQINLCTHEDCPAFDSPDERCWLITNTLCRSPQCVAGREKIYGCLHCRTFPVLGVLIAGSEEITESSLHSLEILSSEIASSVENQRFIEAKKEDIDQLIKLHDISVRSLQNPGASLTSEIVSSVRQFSEVDAAILWLKGRDGRLHFTEASNIETALLPKSISVDNTFVGRAISEHRPVETIDMAHTGCLSRVVAHHGFLYAASIPIRFKDAMFGCLALFKKKDFRMSDSEKAVVLLFANQAAAALNTADLFSSFKAEKEFSEAIFNCAATGILVLSKEGRVLKINASGAGILQAEGSAIVGSRIADMYPGAREMLLVESSLAREVTLSLPDGSSIPIGFNNSRLAHSSEGIDGIIVLFRNMTEIKRLQAELKKKAHFETMSKVISGVAHEVRNPLFGISSIGQILDRELDSAQHRALIQAMLKETDRMKRLIEELLLYTRPMRLDIREVDVGTIFEELKQYLQAKREDIALSLQFPHPVVVKADRDKIVQVFLNLLNNAADAAKGVITVSARSLDGGAEIRISDDGPGIKEDDMGRIFDPFFTTKKGGTGLGLPICKKIVEDHGGEIEVQGSAGTGTTVTLFLKA